MPYRMQADDLRGLYLDNDLASGRFMVDGRPAALQNIDAELTFVLTSGGHNAGIVSEPGHLGRRYRIMPKKHGEICLGPDEWFAAARMREGSWWHAWTEWLDGLSSPEQIAPPAFGRAGSGCEPLREAPGTHVMQR